MIKESPTGTRVTSKSPLTPLAILTVTYAVGYIGTSAILSAIGFWYLIIAKPAWSIPNWSLEPIWLLFLGLLGGAGWAWWNAPASRTRNGAIVLLGCCLALSQVWVALFFRGHRLLPAVVAAGTLDLAMTGAFVLALRARPVAARLLFPGLVWALYAGALTFAVWRANR